MKKILFLIVTLSISEGLFQHRVLAQQPYWLWAKSSEGANGKDLGTGVSADANGNIYVTGYFESDSITFGSITLYNVDPAGSSSDIFIVKYDNAGNVLWAKSAGGSDHDRGNSITTDDSGNSYVTGFFGDTITFGSHTLISASYDNIFIVKHDSDGNALWAKSTQGGGFTDSGMGICLDGNGNIYVTGRFEGTIHFGTTTLTNPGESSDFFIVKYDTDGNALWAKSAGFHDCYEGGTSISADATGNSYVTGTFYCGITFDSITLTGNPDAEIAYMFIVKYDPEGNALWAKSSVNPGYGEGSADISVDSNGNSYITGEFGYTLIFDSITLTNIGAGGTDIFIVKYDPDGNALWAINAGSTDQFDRHKGKSICVDGYGNSYVTGEYVGPITFGSTTFNYAYNEEIFIVKYDTWGNAIWATRAFCDRDGSGIGICLDGNGNIYITGSISGYFSSTSAYFGVSHLTCTDGYGDTFIAKHGNNAPVGTTEEEAIRSFLIYPNPAPNTLTIETETAQGIYQLHDLTGKQLLSGTITATKFSLEISALSKGIYLLSVFDGEQEAHRKIVKE